VSQLVEALPSTAVSSDGTTIGYHTIGDGPGVMAGLNHFGPEGKTAPAVAERAATFLL
jgi:hypothetical protein